MVMPYSRGMSLYSAFFGGKTVDASKRPVTSAVAMMAIWPAFASASVDAPVIRLLRLKKLRLPGTKNRRAGSRVMAAGLSRIRA